MPWIEDSDHEVRERRLPRDRVNAVVQDGPAALDTNVASGVEQRLEVEASGSRYESVRAGSLRRNGRVVCYHAKFGLKTALTRCVSTCPGQLPAVHNRRQAKGERRAWWPPRAKCPAGRWASGWAVGADVGRMAAHDSRAL